MNLDCSAEIDSKQLNSLDPIVVLNVWGTLFTTKKSTLINQSNLFKSLLGHIAADFSRDQALFIDRDPDLFKEVLRFLRDPNYLLCDSELKDQLSSELDYYGIDKRIMNKHMKEYSTLSLIQGTFVLRNIRSDVRDFMQKEFSSPYKVIANSFDLTNSEDFIEIDYPQSLFIRNVFARIISVLVPRWYSFCHVSYIVASGDKLIIECILSRVIQTLN